MNIIKKIINNLLPVDNKKQELLEVFNKIVESSYYDKNTDTLVVKSPTNIIIHTEGNQVFVAKGCKIDLANQIHLNPEIMPTSKLNINKTKVNIKHTIMELDKIL
jgi:hypothetical protein